jgi:hypothetical protein
MNPDVGRSPKGTDATKEMEPKVVVLEKCPATIVFPWLSCVTVVIPGDRPLLVMPRGQPHSRASVVNAADSLLVLPSWLLAWSWNSNVEVAGSPDRGEDTATRYSPEPTAIFGVRRIAVWFVTGHQVNQATVSVPAGLTQPVSVAAVASNGFAPDVPTLGGMSRARLDGAQRAPFVRAPFASSARLRLVEPRPSSKGK